MDLFEHVLKEIKIAEQTVLLIFIIMLDLVTRDYWNAIPPIAKLSHVS